MSFLYPWFLLALSAISIPIIIHLFRFRKFKKVYFSNINFLQHVTSETKKQSQLKHLLVLMMRILAIVFLVLAFSRPYLPSEESFANNYGNRVSLYIDNSFSMESTSSYGTMLDHAKQNASEIVRSFEPTDRFQLLTNDFEGKHQRYVSQDEFMQMLNEVDFSPRVKTLEQINQRQEELIREENPDQSALIFMLSDFQKNVFSLDQLEPDSTMDYFFLPYQNEERGNVYIDSVWINSPVRLIQQPLTITARIFNESDVPLENQPLRLYVSDVQRAIASYDINANSFTDVELTYTLSSEPIQNLQLEITDFPVTFDDRFYLSFQLSKNIPVLIINQDAPNRFINTLLNTDSLFEVKNTQISTIDYASLSRQNLIILNEITNLPEALAGALNEYVTQGGNLLIFPAANMERSGMNRFLSSINIANYGQLDTIETKVSSINEMHDVYQDVFDEIPENINLPEVEKYYVLEQQTRSRQEYLLQLQNGNLFFTSTRAGKGNVFLSAVPASEEFSNFQRHAIFVPTIYNIALYSNEFYPLWNNLSEDESVLIRNYDPQSDEVLTLTGPDVEVIPEMRSVNNNIRLFFYDQLTTAEHYQLMSGQEQLRTLSFNYDRRESRLSGYSPEELEQELNVSNTSNFHLFDSGSSLSVNKQMEHIKSARQLWKIFLIIALLFLFAEVLLLRLWK
ncbi:MAG: BatA domain-containing protein [Bacteroidales bacterium]